MNEENKLNQKVSDNTEQQDKKRSVVKMKKEWKFFKKKKSSETQKEEKPERWVQIRLIPIWLRILLTLLLLVLMAILGLFIGFSVLGDGTPSEIFKKETWTHITDIIQGIE